MTNQAAPPGTTAKRTHVWLYLLSVPLLLVAIAGGAYVGVTHSPIRVCRADHFKLRYCAAAAVGIQPALAKGWPTTDFAPLPDDFHTRERADKVRRRTEELRKDNPPGSRKFLLVTYSDDSYARNLPLYLFAAEDGNDEAKCVLNRIYWGSSGMVSDHEKLPPPTDSLPSFEVDEIEDIASDLTGICHSDDRAHYYQGSSAPEDH